MSSYRFPADAPPDDIAAAMAVHGCAIVENVLPREVLDRLQAQIDPILQVTDGDGQNAFNGEFTKRSGSTMWLVPEARNVVRHPLVIAMLERTLKNYAPTYKLTFDGIMHVMAGQRAQVLHRDNVPFENTPTTPPVLFATLWAVQEFKRENGGTVFVPGSHLWPEDRYPLRSELACAEMPAGSVLLYYGNLIHGAGRSIAGTRTALSLQYAVSWLQQEENQAFAVPHDVLATFDEDLLKLLGVDIISRNCGSVAGRHPLDHVLKDGKNRTLATPGYEYSNGKVRGLKLDALKIRTADCHYHVTLDD